MLWSVPLAISGNNDDSPGAMLRSFLTRRRTSRPPPQIPPGTCLYAIGDIHGEAGLLRDLHAQIRADAGLREADRKILIHLGDYVDRGLASKEVLDYLCRDPMPEFETIYLMGNHDWWFRTFLDEPEVGLSWLENGGRATLYSYGVALSGSPERERWLHDLHGKLVAAVPQAHVNFVDQCAYYHIEGDYAFVHAGIRPGTPLAQQRVEDLLWIRDAFLESFVEHGHVIVHGHTVVEQPEIWANRIAIDTGAYASAKLTALVLEGEQRAFLSTREE